MDRSCRRAARPARRRPPPTGAHTPSRLAHRHTLALPPRPGRPPTPPPPPTPQGSRIRKVSSHRLLPPSFTPPPHITSWLWFVHPLLVLTPLISPPTFPTFPPALIAHLDRFRVCSHHVHPPRRRPGSFPSPPRIPSPALWDC
ncbi:unnamed protein product [Nyctereutes procyonoides]|uniref:(raccoon dog) hypothetical protein n=1 Tax=Nyctereutes procyonoides TaxID=34880 RepID=A0A811ZUK1_NYCPR|nr:unnamed protein product [Nyctereutes procyonoides]